ncbi:MAG TPA: hypothetical protein VFX20_09430 [Steroidobacteraceae bacterium]|nr:hypothetical protein [Steroidobacteraceae bacterium]
MFDPRRHPATLLGFALILVLPVAYGAPVSPAQLAGALHWRNIGPYIGGRVTTVAGVPGKPNLYYAGFADGGVWTTEDYGNHWKNVTDKYFNPDTSGSVGAIAVAPSNPKIIYAGTGDSAPRNTVVTGHGMYKSADAGKTWSYIGLGETHIITWILVDPNNPDVVYVAALGHLFGPNADRGVFKTMDGGRTWKKILYVNDHTGAATLAMNPRNPQVVYASMWQMSRRPWTFSSGGPDSGIYKSTDGGATWSNITHNPGLPTGIIGKASLAVAPSDPDVVYAMVQARVAGQAGALFRSDDAGATWKMVNAEQEISQRAFYSGRVWLDPKDPNTLYITAVVLYVSHDGGKTFSTLPRAPDNHALWINPDNPQIMVEGNDNGVAVSLDRGKTWSTTENQPTAQFYHVNLDDQFPFRVYGAGQDRGSMYGPSAVPAGLLPPVWKDVQGGEEGWLVPVPGQPWITYGDGYFGKEYRENRRIGQGLITDISPWPQYKFGVPAANLKYRYNWIYNNAVIPPHNSNALLLGAQVLLESTDRGNHWKAISPDLTRDDKSKQQRPGGPISSDVTSEENFDTISSIAVSPFNDDIIWTGSDDGLVYLTKDGGAHWSQVRPAGLPQWITVTCIEPSHTDPGTAYLSASRYQWDDFKPYLYKTTDYGKHWTEITSGLPGDQYVQSVRQDPNDGDLLLAATNATVHFSVDGGAHWQRLTLNLPPVRVTDIAIQPEQHAVVISTYGRAFWVLDDLQLLEQLRTANVSGETPYLFKPQQTWLVTRSSFTLHGNDIGGENLLGGAAVYFHLPQSYDGNTPVKLSFTDPSGRVISSFTLSSHKAKTTKSGFGLPARAEHEPVHPGMNRFLWDLRYADATEVKGIFIDPIFGVSSPAGPEVMPGTYYAVLTYRNTTQKQPFVVKLDPNLSTTTAELQQRFDLLMQIHDTIDRLNTNLNRAIDARGALQKALSARSVSAHRAQQALAGLNRDIDSVVDFKITTLEGPLNFPPRLRAWLGFITKSVNMAFVAPTPSQRQVADMEMKQANTAISRLQSDVSNAKSVLRH